MFEETNSQPKNFGAQLVVCDTQQAAPWLRRRCAAHHALIVECVPDTVCQSLVVLCCASLGLCGPHTQGLGHTGLT